MKWFLNIGNLAKAIGSILALTGIILGGIRGYNKAVIAHDRKILKEQSRDVKIDRVLVKLDSLEAGQGELKEIVSEHTEKLDGVARSQATLKNIVTKEFAKTMTPQQVLEMMEQFEIKKNGSFLNGIPSEEKNILITSK